MKTMLNVGGKVTVIALSASLLFGCASPSMVKENEAKSADAVNQVLRAHPATMLKIGDRTPGTAANADYLASRPIETSKRASRPWLGARMAEVQSDENLPPIFYKAQKFNFADPKGKTTRLSLRAIAERITAITSIPVRLSLQSGHSAPIMATPISASAPMPSPLPLPENGAGNTLPQDLSGSQLHTEYITSLESIGMKWDSHLAGFLDHITNQLSLSWSYRGGAIIIEKMMTETFELAAFGVEQSFKMELSGGNSGNQSGNGASSNTQSTLEMSEKGKLETLIALKKAFDTVVKPSGGEVVLNDATGRFYVTATKDAMTKVRQIFKAEDESLLRQAQIQIDIYSVIRDDTDEAGVDWNIAFESLANSWGAVMTTPATLTGALSGGLGATILQNKSNTREFANSSAMIKMLNSVGTTAKHTPINLIAMNRQWARKTNLKTDGYLSETTPSTSSSAGSGAPGLKTSQITTGDKFMVQPAILDSGMILLKFGLSLTQLVDMFDVTAGQGDSFQKVQTPVTTGTDDQSTVRLEPGQAMVVTGLSRKLNAGNRRVLTDGAPIWAGGSRTIQNQREDFVVVIRAVQF
ncbi:hypothetical protein KXJ72_17670 (plasmid) [Comamonas aquatica]|nr:hypothetical protein KXJ72_17670 [Comamonas aquatica]